MIDLIVDLSVNLHDLKAFDYRYELFMNNPLEIGKEYASLYGVVN